MATHDYRAPHIRRLVDRELRDNALWVEQERKHVEWEMRRRIEIMPPPSPGFRWEVEITEGEGARGALALSGTLAEVRNLRLVKGGR